VPFVTKEATETSGPNAFDAEKATEASSPTPKKAPREVGDGEAGAAGAARQVGAGRQIISTETEVLGVGLDQLSLIRAQETFIFDIGGRVDLGRSLSDVPPSPSFSSWLVVFVN
jgi:hypothetical protein